MATNIGYRLVIMAPDGVTPELVISSLGANVADDVNRPFLSSDPPAGSGASADLIEGTTTVGEIQVRLWDEPTDAAPPPVASVGLLAHARIVTTSPRPLGSETAGGACSDTVLTLPLPTEAAGPSHADDLTPVDVGNGWYAVVPWADQTAGATLTLDAAFSMPWYAYYQRTLLYTIVDVSSFGSCGYHLEVTVSDGSAIVSDGGSAGGHATGTGLVIVAAPSKGLGGAAPTQQYIGVTPADYGGTVTITSVVLRGID